MNNEPWGIEFLFLVGPWLSISLMWVLVIGLLIYVVRTKMWFWLLVVAAHAYLAYILTFFAFLSRK